MNRISLSIALASLLPLASCASTGPQYEQNPITHTVTEADLALAKSKKPIEGSAATLYVNGLGCPLCASNIDRQLARVRGMRVENVDLSTGKVGVHFTDGPRPSPAAIGNAVEDAGFTLVKIEPK